jgi:hypothetical protein
VDATIIATPISTKNHQATVQADEAALLALIKKSRVKRAESRSEQRRADFVV